MNRLLPSAAIAIALIATSTAVAASLSLKDQMKQVVEPASNTLFGVGGDVDPANGPDAAKVPDARWAEGAQAAQSLEDAAATLTEKGHVKPGADWAKFAREMAAISDAALKAAKAKDGAGLSTAANALSDNCAACHAEYKKQS